MMLILSVHFPGWANIGSDPSIILLMLDACIVCVLPANTCVLTCFLFSPIFDCLPWFPAEFTLVHVTANCLARPCFWNVPRWCHIPLTHTELEVFISLWIRWVQLSDKFKEIKEANWKKENRFTVLWWWWCETMQTKCSWFIPVVSCRLLGGGDISTWHISPLPFRFITAVAVQFHLCTDYACWLWKTNNILILG